MVNFTLLLLCFVSYSWAMRRFFTRPAVVPRVARWVSVLGSVTIVAHGLALLLRPLRFELPSAINALASGLFVGALALFFWALRVNLAAPLSSIGAPDLPTHLVTSGPYRFVRHPFYLAYLLTWIASALSAGTPWLWLPVLAAVPLYVMAARFEERKFAASALAGDYAAYARRTGMLFPRLWPLSPAGRITRRSLLP